MEKRALKKDDNSMERGQNILIGNESCCIDSKIDLKHFVESKIVENLTNSETTRLNLSSCFLFEFPFKFCSLDYITELNVSGNKLETLPNEFVDLKKLRKLDISKNLFNELPSPLFNGLLLLKFLNASSNKIELINKPPCCLPMLQHLDLSSNQLIEPPHWLLYFTPTFLETINLSNNPCFLQCSEKVNTFTEEKVADNVKTLKLTNCRLREGDEIYLQNFSTLKKLEMGNDENSKNNFNCVSDLRSLPDSIEELILPNMGLAVVSKCITNMINLRFLDISGNMVHWLPASIQNLQALEVLRAESCNICLLPPEMNSLSHLKELHLGSNQLSSAEGFENLISLELLDLYENQFISIPSLNQFFKLVALDLSQNYMEPPEIIEINFEKHNYEELQNLLRSKNSSKLKRRNGSQEFPTILEDDLNEEFSDYTSEELDIEDTELDDHVQDQKSGVDHLVQDCWEEDENDIFDPNVSIKMNSVDVNRSVSYESLTGETPYEVTTHPHYFIPFKFVSPVMINKTALPPPVEGQFDD